jgi:ferredoxin-type protein NapF
VVCQSCGDACPEAAICFPPRLGTAPKPMVEHSACSGCGACVSACPVSAVRLVPSESETDRG